MNELRTIRLYGALGARFGREHRLSVTSPKEAIKALSVVIQGFEAFMLSSKQRGLTFAVFNGKRNIHVDELETAQGYADIRIAPMVIGSKKAGLFQTILGVALVAVAAIATGGVGAAFAAGGLWGTTALVGASMVLGGIVQMLSPQAAGLGVKEDPYNKPSYAFGGAVNSTAQGNPIALGYGKRRVGGAVISASILAEDQQ